jgi:Iap family predicted aminopeptidase
VAYLASPECSGRKVASEGDRKATSYLADEFKALGLKPLFGQSFVREMPAAGAADAQARLEVLDEKGAVTTSYTYFRDFSEMFFPKYGETTATGSLLVSTGQEPPLSSPTVLLVKCSSQDVYARAQRAGGTKCVAVLFTDPSAKPGSDPLRYATRPAMSNVSTPVFRVQPQCYDDLAKRTGATVRVSVTSQDLSSKEAWNVGAALGDPSKQQAIVVLAHKDHMGTLPDGTLFPGAIDNASGVATVLEVARELKSAHLSRAIVFLAVDGEEAGGAGGRDFLKDPPFPGSNIYVALNMDCLAVLGEGPLALCSGGGEAAVTLATLARQALTAVGLPTVTAEPEELSSDHMAFIAAGYPAVGLLSTMDSMSAYLHKSSDGPGAVDVKELAATTLAIAEAILEIAK